MKVLPLPGALALLALLGLGLSGCHRDDALRAPNLIISRPGVHDGQLRMPRALAFSPDGARLYVLDRTHRVQVFDPDGRFLLAWETPPGDLGNPRSLDIAPDGTVILADTHNSQIVEYSPEGVLLRKFGHMGRRPGEFAAVTSVKRAPDGSLWTTEYGNYQDRVQKLDAAGRPLLTYGVFGRGSGQINRPQGLAIGPEGRVYVADAVNHRLLILDEEGRRIGGWGTPDGGDAPGELRYPYDVAVDRQGRVYVAEFGNSRISVFTAEGAFLTSWGRPGRAPGEFDHPWGVALSPRGEVYVADTMNYRIQRFDPLPQRLATR